MGEIIEFIRMAGKLKRLPRAGWVESGVEKPESVADHCFRTAILAMVVADVKGLDAEKVMRMALLHDLAEAETGDLTPEQKARMGPNYGMREDEAIRRIFAKLPRPLAERYISLLKEHRESSTPEAKVVSEADKAEMLIQAIEYEEEGAERSGLQRFWETEIRDDVLSELLKDEVEKRRVKS